MQILKWKKIRTDVAKKIENKDAENKEVENKWDDIFTSPRNAKVWGGCIVVSFIVIICVAVYNNYSKDAAFIEIVKNALPTILLTIATSVLGAAFLNIVYRENENRKLKLIKSLGYDNMLSAFFKTLDELNGKVRRDEQIEVEFSKLRDEKDEKDEIKDSLYKVKIRYNYKTFLKDNCIKFMFERINGETKKVQNYTSGLNNDLIGYEFYWGNDETGFGNTEIGDNDYKIYDVFVDSHSDDLVCETFKTNPAILEFVYKLPSTIKCKNREMNIRYTVEFPMERESIMFLTHELPTQNATVKIDYSKIRNDTLIYTMPVTGTIPVQKHLSQEEKGSETYTYNGWIIPKAGYIIAWWDKDE